MDIEFLDLTDLESSPIGWLIEDWLIDSGVTLLIAEGGAGKTLLGLDIALALSTGRPWLSAGKPFKQGEPKRIWFFDEDGSPALMRRRLKYMMAGHGIDAAKLEASGMLKVASSNGYKIDGRQFITELAVNNSANHPDLIIFDALVAMSAADENSNSEMRGVMRDGFRAVASNLETSILLIHHVNKPGESTHMRSDLHRSRGSSEIVNSVDTAWAYTNYGKVKKDRKLSLLRSRVLAENDWPEPLFIGLRASGESWALNEAPGSNRDKLIARITELGITSSAKIDHAHKILNDAGHECSRASVGRAIKLMKADNIS